jgi:UDP-N-acetylglucosamine acyltransferase
MRSPTRRALRGSPPRIHPTAVVDPEAEIAADVQIGPYAVVGPKVSIGPGTRIMHHATVVGRTRIGRDNVIYPYATLGTEPQDLKYAGEDTELVLGDRNTIREYVTINIGTAFGGGVTRIGNDCLLMACSHVAHDCRLGNRVILSNCALLGGHVVVGDGAILSGLVGVHHFVTIGRNAFISGGTRVAQDAPPFMIVQGEKQQVKCVNVVGLRRHGFPEATIEALRDAHRMIWRGPSIRSRALAEAERRLGHVPEVRELVEFLRASAAGRNGRALERERRNGVPAEEAGEGP